MNLSKVFLYFLAFFIVACGGESSAEEKIHSAETVADMKHEHEHEHEHEHGDIGDVIDLSSVEDPPVISFEATPDAEGGAMLAIELENFELVPIETKSGNQPRQGHLHVDLDGETVAMISENHYYLSNLVNGQHEIAVSLSSIDHRSYYLDGKPISDSVMVMISGGSNAEVPDVSFEVEILEGKVKDGLSRFEVSKGDLVEITVYSDKSDEVHLHVYDNMVNVGPGAPAVINVEATIPGIFEAELHSAGFRIFELQVS